MAWLDPAAAMGEARPFHARRRALPIEVPGSSPGMTVWVSHPMTNQAARPAEPTRMRHQANGAKPWRLT
jgi:hypothetical protein